MPAKTPYPKQQAPSRRRAAKGETYDGIVVGGGPAGLSAAIYLARYNRSVLVIDAGEGRSTSHETNQNYLGFPAGIRQRELRARGVRQAERYGAKFARGRVTSVERSGDGFNVRCGRRRYAARTVILATGVVDRFPKIRALERCIGISVFWCITCDGWKARGKRMVVVGNTDDAATTALQFLEFTDRVTVLTNSADAAISAKKQRQLSDAGIELVADELAGVESRDGRLRAAITKGGRRLPLQLMFNSQGCDTNIELARGLRLKLDGDYIKTDNEQRTNVARVYAAGDVTKAFAHQVVTAAHEGATAAQAANFDLYRPEQRA